MRKIVGAIVGILFGFVAASAFAETTWFNNNLNSWIMVSPAQLYQVQGNKVDANFQHVTGKTTDDVGATGKTESDLTTNVISADGIYSVGTELKTGVSAGMRMANVKSTEKTAVGSTDSKSDFKNTFLKPQVAYQIHSVASVGMAIEMDFDSVDTENSVKYDCTSYVVRPGALYTMKNLEAGLVYQTQVDQEVEVTINDQKQKFQVQKAGSAILHGRYALDQNMAFGTQLEQVMWGSLKTKNYTTGESTATDKDQQIVRIFAEYGMNSLKTEGGYAYKTAYYKNKENMDSANIGTMELSAAADYSINKEAAVGGGLAYDFGSDKNGDEKYATNDMTVQVRGKVAF